MRVTFLMAALDMGGGARVVAQYAQALSRRGHDVLVVSPPQRPYGLRNKIRDFVLGGKVSSAHHFQNTDPAVKLLRRYRSIRPSDVPKADVIVATWWETAEWLATFPRNRGRQVHFVQDYEIWNGQRGRVDAALKRPTQKITISNWLRTILVTNLAVEEPAVIANGVDQHLFYPTARPGADEPIVGFVYAPNPRKGAKLAWEALAKAKAQIPGLKCVVFGHVAPPTGQPLPDYAEFHVAPPQAELRQIYGRCSIWLFPSYQEGFGLPILEAMACGTPVIATPAGAAPEILADGGGMLLDSYDAETMSQCIVDFFRLPSQQQQALSLEARIVAERFSLDNAAERFSSYIETLSCS